MRAVLFLAIVTAGLAASPVDHDALTRKAAASAESTWRKLDGPSPDLSSRELFTSALAWCEAGIHADRLERMFDTAARMHDTDPASPGYGNFRWSWKHAVVFDRNAVEFSMQGGALLWLRHRERMPAAARDRLRPILELGTEGCLRHRVRESYTNIALMNAGNLILLGEALGNVAAAKEGYRRLDRIVLYTSQAGIHEFGSPTYYGVDLDDLLLIEAFCREDRGREQARALLELFWTDIALNFHPAAGRYAGAYSRNYDYLHGWGGLETHLYLNGWTDRPEPSGGALVFPLLGRWSPPDSFRALANRFPREVRQVWGSDPLQTRTHFLDRDISLGSATTGYGGRMDFLLTADLKGTRDSVRCYFTPDGRGDPYGKNKIAESVAAEAHQKALHLVPFWTAAQRQGEALAMVVYRPGDVPPDTVSLESHFVMPRAAVFTVGGRAVDFSSDKPLSVDIGENEEIMLRQGGGALGIRLPWTNGAPARLVFDGNAHGAVRLTVNHRGGPPRVSALPPSAVLWVRVASGLTDNAAAEAWRGKFAADRVACEANPRGITVRRGDALMIRAEAPFQQAGVPLPLPTTALIEHDGRDIGAPILRRVEPVRSLVAQPPPQPIRGEPGKPIRWEAETGRLVPFFAVGEDQRASGGKFVWLPGDPGQPGGADLGSVSWNIRLTSGGGYQLRGRVKSPTSSDDSFRLRLLAAGGGMPAPVDWSVGVHKEWTWVWFNDPATRKPKVFDLATGATTIEILPREDGTCIDQLELVPVR